MSSSPSIICIGELLVDFICDDVGVDLVSGVSYKKRAGGAPANVCATISKMGGESIFCGKVGNDPFGHFLKESLEDLNVNTSMVQIDETNQTTLAFVALKEDGERDFVFNRGADRFLTEEEVDLERFKNAGILHFGSATALLEEPLKSTYFKLMRDYNDEHHIISFDPNYRPDLWRERELEFITLARNAILYADFVKVSEEELRILTAQENIQEGVKELHQLGADLVAVTLGKKGTFISNRTINGLVPSIKINSFDSTGAGDAFVGAFLYQLSLEKNPQEVINDFQKIKTITAFSNKVGALVCEKLGAISAIPSQDELV
mgnify:CR=1 FL=1